MYLINWPRQRLSFPMLTMKPSGASLSRDDNHFPSIPHPNWNVSWRDNYIFTATDDIAPLVDGRWVDQNVTGAQVNFTGEVDNI